MTIRQSLRVRCASLMLVSALAVTPAVTAQDTGAGDRSMAFRPGLGEAARERVPGGRLLVIAYSAVLALLGGYVVFIARKAHRVEADLRRLEDDLEARRKGD